VETLAAILLATLGAGTPLVFAALGELVTEKSGVLNLGVEGMMVMGAVCGFAVATESGSLWLGVLAALLAGSAMAGLFALLTLTFQANQVAAGLALTQPLVLSLDPLVYLSFVLFACVSWFLYRTRAGLVLRGIGEAPASAHAIGYPVIPIRYLAVIFGGAMAGLGGAYLALVYTPLWVEGMAAGRGWISLALVVFATWRPLRVLFGAYLFGGITIVQFHVQAIGVDLPSQLLSMLPYLATIVVLVLISRDLRTIRLHAPASLGMSYHPAA
jgi:simple sugar transport system permease protein